MLSQMTGVPIVPIASVPKRAIQMNSWDRFLLPGWFNRFSVAVGKPVIVEKGLSLTDLEPIRLRLQSTLIELSENAAKASG